MNVRAIRHRLPVAKVKMTAGRTPVTFDLRIGETGAEATVVDWGPDGDRLLVTDNTEDRSRCGVYDLRTDEIEWYGRPDYEETAVSFLPDGNWFLAHRTSHASVQAIVYDSAGSARELDLSRRATSFSSPFGESVLDGDRVLLTHDTGPTARAAGV